MTTITTIDSCAVAGAERKKNLTCRIETRFEPLEPLREQWDRAVTRCASPIYMTYDWARIWWKYYGAGRRLRIFIFENGKEIVSVLPLFIDAIGLPPVQIRVARLVGANIPPKVFDPPVPAELAEEIWGHVFGDLFDKQRIDVLSIGPVSETFRQNSRFQQTAMDGFNGRIQTQSNQRDVQTIYWLPPTYEEFFNGVDAKERKIRRKKLRELEAVHPLRVEMVREPSRVEGEFAAFERQHTSQWQGDNRPGHFHAWPNALKYNEELVRTLGRLGRVCFVKLFAGEHVAANQYTFTLGNTLYAELPARLSGPDWDKFSLGCTSQIKLLEAAIQAGFNRMDSGLGHYEYKVLLNGQESPVHVMQAFANTRGTRLKMAFWSRMRSSLELALHKTWYRRIMPMMPAFLRGGQSSHVLRLDY